MDFVCEGQALSTYEDSQFERVCLEWVARQNRVGGLPFIANSFGRWWDADSTAREQADIDLVVADTIGRKLACGECKWRNSFDESEAIRTLEHRSRLVGGN